MSDPAATQERSISTQLNETKAKLSNTEDHEAAVIYDKNNQKAVRGIVYSLLFSIPFWLIIIMLVVWLV